MMVITPWSWLIFAAVLAGLEVIAPGAFMIWLSGAAVVTAALAGLLRPGAVVQVASFVVLSVAAVLVARRWFATPRPPADPELNQRTERMIGTRCVVVEPIVGGAGRVQIGDSPWSATGPDLAVGTPARILRVEGTTVVVTAA